MPDSALYFEPFEQAQERLERLLAEYQRDNRLAPVTVIVPSTYAGLHLRRDIGRRGLVNVQFLVLSRLAELLGAPGLAAKGMRPLKPLIESAAVRGVAQGASGRLEQFRDHPSFHSSLRSTFRDLRYATASALAALKGRGEISSEIVRLYGIYRERVKTYYDRESLTDAAADAVTSGNATALNDLGPVISYLLRALTPGERRLLDALREAWVCSTVLGVTGEPQTDEDVLGIAPPRGTDHPQRTVPTPHSETSLLITTDTREEVRNVVRSIASAAHEGTPFSKMAVLYWQREPYASLISEQFAMAEVPAAGPSAGRLASTPVGRMVKGMVSLAGGDLPRDEITRWLTSSPVKSTSAGFRPSRWDAISRDAGVVAGIEQWSDRLARYAGRQERAAKDRSEDIADARRLRLERSANETWALRRFMLKLHDDLTPPEDGGSWADFVEWVEDLIVRYMDSAGLPPKEAQNLDALESAVQELASLDDVDKDGTTLDVFRSALDEALGRSAAREGSFGDGVFVGPVGNAVGLRFDRVYLLGMVEGLVPPRVRDDPLLPDREREQAGLPSRRSLSVERYEYLAAASSGRKRVLTFARGDTTVQKAQHPSRWFLEEASRLHGSQVFASTLADQTKSSWLDVVESQEGGLRKLGLSQPADLHDYDLHRLWLWRRSGRRISEHYLALSENILTRALWMERARNVGRVTEWDGDLSAVSRSSKRIALSDRKGFFPSRLGAWAVCPYRYFLFNVIGIADPERPEEIMTISTLERGNLIHSILEGFIWEVQKRGNTPLPDQPWSGEHRQLLTRVAEEEFGKAEGLGVTGKPLLWEIARAEILKDLSAFLDADFKMRRTHGVSPRSVEVAFGASRHRREDTSALGPVEWLSPKAGAIRFRGIIDRIDVSPSDDTALVLDYKTGGTGAYTNMNQDPVRRGTQLQLPVYGLAARQLLGDQVEVKVAYWFVSEKEKFATRPSKPMPLDKMLKSFTEAIETVADGIRAGLFPANPGKDRANCRYCDFKNLCPTRRERHWERKRRDPRLSAYAAMAQGEGNS